MCIHMGISSPLHIFDNSRARETHVGCGAVKLLCKDTTATLKLALENKIGHRKERALLERVLLASKCNFESIFYISTSYFILCKA